MDIEQHEQLSDLACAMLCGAQLERDPLVDRLLQSMTVHELITGLSGWLRVASGAVKCNQETNNHPRFDKVLVTQLHNQALAAMKKG